MEKFSPEKIFIDREVIGNTLVGRITKHFAGRVPIEYVLHSDLARLNEATLSKALYLTLNRGSFVKKCPGTNGFICCNYYVIDLVENCHLSCSYCFLKSYLRDGRIIKVYVNIDKLFLELSCLLSDKSKFFRIGTGELSDSLALDAITGFSKLLVDYFKDKDNALLELKTKTNEIGNLLKIDNPSNVVISWSLNPSFLVESEEFGTSSVGSRIESASLLEKKGYKLAFHFDPIIYYDNWEEDYRSLIDDLFSFVSSRNIVWISLGGLRFSPSMLDVCALHESAIFYGEFLRSPDGKMRYFIKIREMLYKKIKSMLRAKDKSLFIYLCMEGKYMWKRAFDFVPRSDIKLDNLFKRSIDKVNVLNIKEE